MHIRPQPRLWKLDIEGRIVRSYNEVVLLPEDCGFEYRIAHHKSSCSGYVDSDEQHIIEAPFKTIGNCTKHQKTLLS